MNQQDLSEGDNTEISRPTSVSVVSWILIIFSVLSMVLYFANLSTPGVKEMMQRSTDLPIMFLSLFTVVGTGVVVYSAVGMIHGKNYARWLYVCWTVFNILVGLLMMSGSFLMMIPAMIMFAIFCMILFQPNANRFFKENQKKNSL